MSTPSLLLLQDQISPDTLVKVIYDDENETPKYVLGYWSIRGLGSPLRMMLSASGCAQRVPHWVALYDVQETDDGGWSKESYLKDKKTLLLPHNPMANLPFLIDVEEQFVVCQSNAIFSYLGRELDMMGSNKKEQAKCDELLCEVMDLRDVMIHYAYNMGSYRNSGWTQQEAVQRVLKNTKRHLFKLEKHLEVVAVHSSYLVGTKVSAPDFHLWEMLHQLDGITRTFQMKDQFWSNFPRLLKYYQEFIDLPCNTHWKTCFCHQHLPYNNPYAVFGSSSSQPNTPEDCRYKRGQEAKWRGHGVLIEKLEQAKQK